MSSVKLIIICMCITNCDVVCMHMCVYMWVCACMNVYIYICALFTFIMHCLFNEGMIKLILVHEI